MTNTCVSMALPLCNGDPNDWNKFVSYFGHDSSERHKGIRDYNACPMCAPEIKDFQKRAGDDLEDYYSGNYANRLRQKASQLGNAKSDQDFTPKALKEAVSRAIRKYLR